MLGPLPAELASHWRRGDRYYDTDGWRLEAIIKRGGAGDDGYGMDDYDGVDGEDIVALDDDGDDGDDVHDGQAQAEEAIPDSPIDDDMSESSGFWLANSRGFLPLEDQLRHLRPEDMEDA